MFTRTLGFRGLVGAALLLLSACGGPEGGDRERPPPLVTASSVQSARFVERVESVGTANANESVTVSAPVTERVVRLGFDDGDYVSRGQVLAVLAQAQESADLAEANARAAEAAQQLERIEALSKRGFATRVNLDQQRALVAQARAQAQNARATIGDRIVRAPFPGWASLRNISPGAVVQAGSEIVTVSDISSIKLDFSVPETALSALRPGLTIEARSAAYPDQPFRGQIAVIDPVIDPTTRAVKVRARLPNNDRKLKPGMLLTVAIETAPRMSLSVPELSVVGEGDQRFVYVIDKGKAVRTRVRTGVRSAGLVEILEGLKPGQQVVTEGVVKLSDGMRVRLAGQGNAGAGAGASGGAGAAAGGAR